ncbi:hypothetical protein EH223_04510 [candidate division KSB1 bacterium]|nr:hypothetical protein [candidate division KSB1 bacterium]RQW05543.1 MAG: hypothetical protein EH223_04510 [candidate division KSB1 bacterium]
MTQHLNEKEKREALNRIISSETFAHSQAFQELLTYLVDASINNNPPKEFAIATEVFHKGADFDPNRDTIVRVYVYNLRKKLEHYYQHEGREERVRIEIPKGHYTVEFVATEPKRRKKSIRTRWLFIPFVILFCLNVFFIYRLYLNGSSSHFAGVIHSPVWREFMRNGVTKQIVLGDHFFFVKDSNNRQKRTILRRDDVNSVLEFQQYKAESIERRNYVQLRYPMFPKNSVWPMADLVALLSCAQVDYSLEYCSNIKASDFRDKDMLFVGSFHTLGAFEQTFRNSHFSYQVYPNGLSYRDEIVDTVITRQEIGDPVFNHIDYGIARKIPGPDHKTIYMFTSFHETGTHGIVKYFTEEETLQELEAKFVQKFNYIPDYFEILFQASGYNRTVYTTKIEQIFEIHADSAFW